MTQLKRVAFIGNSLPRRCGIATFTTDLHKAVQSSGTPIETCIVAINDDRRAYNYPPDVTFQIRDDVLEDYTQAADFLNAQKYDVVSLQHEFGIFGGDAGAYVLALIARLDMPVVTTCHTVLSCPTPAQYNVLRTIVELSSIVVVMAEKARELLHAVYGVPVEKIEVIPHGIPDFPFVEPDLAKVKLGFTAKPVILTFGLLSPNKGIEVMIEAMPLILKSRADAVYVVLGATHPNLVRQEGEAYREKPYGACARELSAKQRRLSRSVRGSGDFAGFHIHVRRLCDALLQRSANDVGNIGLQLRPGKSGRFDALLARARIAGGWTGHPGSVS